MTAWDAIVVGGGHNGLVAAAYLARAGWRVLVLERLAQSGGAARTGYAYVVSPFPERILSDLGVRVELRARPGTEAELGAELGAELRRLFPTVLEPLPERAEARRLVGEEAWRQLVERPLGEALRERFADGAVRGAVGTDALIGTFTHLDDPSLRQNRCFLWHVMGGPWRVPVGGMGAVSGALAAAATGFGAEIRCDAEVRSIDGVEVTWADATGEEHSASARVVLAGVAPAELDRLRGREPSSEPEGCQTKVNLTLDRVPRVEGSDPSTNPLHGTFHLNEHEDQLARAYEDAAAGRLPADAPGDVYCHGLTMGIFGLQTPARLFRDDNDAAAATMRDRYLDALDEHLEEPIRDCVARDANGDRRIEVKTPLDIERELRMPGGHIFHGDLSWPWLDEPLPRNASAATRWGVATDDPRILICGAGARRGGCVSGISGHNAAMALLSR